MADVTRASQRTWQALTEAGLVQGDGPALETDSSPWYVKALLAFSGWLAALFLLAFVGAGFVFVVKSGTASLLVGALVIAGAYFILSSPRNEFLQHLGLAVSLAGQALVAWGIFRMLGTGEEVVMWLLLALMQAALAAVMPNFVHRVFSTFLSGLGLAMALVALDVPYLFSGLALFAAAWAWLHEFRYPRHIRTIQAAGYGLVLALVCDKAALLPGIGVVRWTGVQDPDGPWVQPWMGEVLVAAVLLYVVRELFRRHDAPPGLQAAGLLAALVLGGASLEAPGVAVGITIMLLGFAGGNRVLLGLGAAALLFYVSAYYYLLDATLLAKAQTLFIAGIVLLAARWSLRRFVARAGVRSAG